MYVCMYVCLYVCIMLRMLTYADVVSAYMHLSMLRMLTYAAADVCCVC